MPARSRLPPMITRRSIAAGLALLLMMAAGAACSAAAPQLTDRAFLSVAVTDNGAARALVPGTRIRLDFRASELGANAGCNSIGGTYKVEGGKLILDAAGMTEMGCDQPRHEQDDWLIEFLSSSPTFRLTGDELTLESGTVVVRLLDRKIVEPDRALAGPTWTVDSIVTGDAVSSIPQGVTATVVFNADGTLTLDAGCNQGGGKWAAVGGGLEISDLILTKKACQGPGAQLEAAVMSVLDAGTITADIQASSLRLQAGPNGLGLRAP